MSGPAHKLNIVLGETLWLDEKGGKPDGRWLARTADGRVTLVKRRAGMETIAFQPIDFGDALRLAHQVIAGNPRVLTDPMTLGALAAVVAEMGLHLPTPTSEGEGT